MGVEAAAGVEIEVEVAPVVVAVGEDKTIFGGMTASVLPAVDDSVDSLVCLRTLMGHRQLVGELAAVVRVVRLHIHCLMILHFVVGSLYCYGHIQAEWFCSWRPPPRLPKTECADLKRAVTLMLAT